MIRRLSFDLTGLPPTPQEVLAFEKDLHPDAYARLVDGLMGRRAFGERMASVWLNLARYAEDQAHQVGNNSSLNYPNAWLYRDWVVAAFNADLPYDAFIKKQQIPQEHLNPMVREKIKGYLEMEKRKEAMDKWLGQQTAKTPVEVYITKPRRPSFDVKVGDAPVTGNKNAKVTIVEFSDFQCPFCSDRKSVV